MSALWLAFRTWGVWKRIGDAVAGAWRWALSSPMHLLIVALALCAAWGWLGWHRAGAAREDLGRAQATIADIRDAQAKAAADQAAVNRAPADKSKSIAEKSNEGRASYLADVKRAGVAWAAAHRVDRVRCPAVGSASGPAAVPEADRAAPVDDRSGVDAGVVAVPRADFDRYVANTARLAEVHRDAEALIAAGVAVASVDTADGTLKPLEAARGR